MRVLVNEVLRPIVLAQARGGGWALELKVVLCSVQ